MYQALLKALGMQQWAKQTQSHPSWCLNSSGEHILHNVFILSSIKAHLWCFVLFQVFCYYEECCHGRVVVLCARVQEFLQGSGSQCWEHVRTTWRGLKTTSASGPTPRGSVSVHLAWSLRTDFFLKKDSLMILTCTLLCDVWVHPLTPIMPLFLVHPESFLKKEPIQMTALCSVYCDCPPLCYPHHNHTHSLRIIQFLFHAQCLLVHLHDVT